MVEKPNPRVRMRWSDSNRRKGNGFKVKGKFNLAFRNKFSTQRKWNRLPKDILCVPSLEAFKVRMDGILGSLIWWLGTLSMAGCLELRAL